MKLKLLLFYGVFFIMGIAQGQETFVISGDDFRTITSQPDLYKIYFVKINKLMLLYAQNKSEEQLGKIISLEASSSLLKNKIKRVDRFLKIKSSPNTYILFSCQSNEWVDLANAKSVSITPILNQSGRVEVYSLIINIDSTRKVYLNPSPPFFLQSK